MKKILAAIVAVFVLSIGYVVWAGQKDRKETPAQASGPRIIRQNWLDVGRIVERCEADGGECTYVREVPAYKWSDGGYFPDKEPGYANVEYPGK